MTTRPASFISFGKLLTYQKGDLIFSEGDSGKEMYVIRSGRIRIFISTGSGSMTLAQIKKGDFFGEMALLEALPRSASAMALTNVELIALEQKDFKFLIQQHPDIAMKVLGKFSSRLRDADNLIQLLLIGDHTGYIIHLLVKEALSQGKNGQTSINNCRIPLSIAELSRVSGLKSNEVKSVLVELQKIGLAQIDGESIIIKKHRKLKYYLKYLEWKGKI